MAGESVVSVSTILALIIGSTMIQSSQCSPGIIAAKFFTSPIAQDASHLVRLLKTNYVPDGVTMSANGPETAPLPIVQAPSITLPTVEAPIVALPSPPIPAPRVLSQRCICTKTVVKPQIIQRQITVPKVQHYFKRTVTPVLENIAYTCRPAKFLPCNTVSGCANAKVFLTPGGCFAQKIC